MADDVRAKLRGRLVEQVRGRVPALSAPVERALRAVPRHLFVPGVAPEMAYQDDAIVTKRDADGQAISSSSQPTMMALMLDQLGLAAGQRVLEIGAGTGYNAALLAHLVAPGGAVTSIDIDLDLVETAREQLAGAGYPQVDVVCGDGAAGYAQGGPYDRIIAAVGVRDLAPAWLEQLAPGGRLVIPLDLGGVQRSVAFERSGAHWRSRSIVSCGFMGLRGSLAGPARTHVLSPDGDLTITVPGGGGVDISAMLAALDGPAVVRSAGIVLEARRILPDLGLWLAVHEPDWCVLSESAAGRRLPGAPLKIQDARVTAGLHDAGGVAILGDEFVYAYGLAAENLADRLVAHVNAWDRAGQPGEHLRIDAYPKPAAGAAPDAYPRATPDAHPNPAAVAAPDLYPRAAAGVAEGMVVDREHCLFVLRTGS